VSEYEYVIDGGLDNEDQEIYLDVNFPEYMVRLFFIFGILLSIFLGPFFIYCSGFDLNFGFI